MSKSRSLRNIGDGLMIFFLLFRNIFVNVYFILHNFLCVSLVLLVQTWEKFNKFYCTMSGRGGGLHLERLNVEWPILRNFEISDIKITKVESIDFF